MVTAAYSSGTPALGVGVGNAVITVDDTADLDDAAEKIRISKTLDLAASCSSDNSVVLVDKIYDQMVAKLEGKGGYVVNAAEKDKLQHTIWHDGHLNTAIVAQPATKIAEMAGINLPEGKTFFIVPETGYGPDHPFSGEKLSVVMALYRVKDIDEAIRLLRECDPLIEIFSESFVAAFSLVKEAEHEVYLQVISSWEREHLLLNV